MAFSIRDLLRFLELSLGRRLDVDGTARLRRLGLVLLFCLLYPLLELGIWASFVLDDVLYGAYRRQPIVQPVFIVGIFRSGTTFLHRLLAQDEHNFATMALWEILFAPSIVLRKAGMACSALDRFLGSPMHRLLTKWEHVWQKGFAAHRISLRAPEEDEYLLLHIWSSLTIWLYAGLTEEMSPYICFDVDMPAPERERIMRFYAQCVRRYLYARGIGRRGPKRYLSKSPPFTGKIKSLCQTFPDAKFILLVRSPLSVVPSFVSFVESAWKLIGGPIGDARVREHLLELLERWYHVPVDVLGTLPESRTVVVRFDDLVRDPAATVSGIYERLGLETRPPFAETLHQAMDRSRLYRSRHGYELEGKGLARDQIVTRYRDVFDRYGFDPCGGNDGSSAEIH